ncbi:MAG: dihydrofolate reductase [Chitinophagales bacterium]|nr:dihydrofolate reductase [Chitinophagales bacterium]
MKISIIVAVSQNNVIGINNKLPWHLPADMKYFKQVTMGHAVIMGRATYESLGKALPGRSNIVVTRQENYPAEDCVVVNNLKSAFEEAVKTEDTECFVIGGADIIQQALVWTDKIYMTRIFHNYEGDTFLKPLNEDDWKLTSEERHLPDEKNRVAYAFQIFELKQEIIPPPISS